MSEEVYNPRKMSQEVQNQRKMSQEVQYQRKLSQEAENQRKMSSDVQNERKMSEEVGRKRSSVDANGFNERELAQAAKPCSRNEDDEAPAGAGNWYLGHCIQKRGVLYPRWGKAVKPVEGMMIGVYGVLYEKEKPLPGALEAIRALKKDGVDVRFCSNTSCRSKASLTKKLHEMGFTDIKEEEVFTPVAAVKDSLQKRGLRPYVIAHPDAMADFQGLDTKDPNCVVIGDAKNAFTYEKLNKAFRILKSLDDPILITMGMGRYYAETDGLSLDVGSFTKMLEFACDIEAEVIGKPQPAFFEAVLSDMGVEPEYGVMIGDDIVTDVAGAKELNIRGVMVRTGKYRPSDEPHPTIHPDGYVDNLLVAADLFLKHR